MHVGAERVRNDAGVERLAGEPVGEVAAVADVDLETAIEGGADHLVDIAVAVDEAARMAGEGMRQDIARLQQRDHARQDGVGVLAIGAALGQAPQLAEMHIDRKLGLAPDLGGELDHLDAPAREAADLGMALDASHDVAVGVGSAHRRIDIDALGAVEVRVVVPLEAADQIGRDEGVDAGLRLLGDEVAEARERHAGRPALIDQGGDARMHPHHVGIEAEPAADIFVAMRMGVDHAGQHQLAGDVDDLLGGARQDVGLHRRDAPVADRHIHHAVDTGRRTDDMAAAQQQIVGFFFHG